jgi:recombination protein RecR
MRYVIIYMSGYNISIIDKLIQSVSRLPGLGPRSARRIVLHLLQKRDHAMQPLIEQLQHVRQSVQTCSVCRNLDVVNPCGICASATRDASTICIVEHVSDLWAIERVGMYRGVYYVLGGVLSAMDGTSPDALGIPELLERVAKQPISEIIMATNATADGQTTAYYIQEQLPDKNIRVTRLAQGIPIGGDLEYIDDNTLHKALQERH